MLKAYGAMIYVEQIKKLKKIARKQDLSQNQVVRKALDLYFEQSEKKEGA